MDSHAPDAGLPPADDYWNAGQMGCGELVMKLKHRMDVLAPGAVLHLVALDPGAVEDLPAWCGLTGHGLVAFTPPHFFIQRKGA